MKRPGSSRATNNSEKYFNLKIALRKKAHETAKNKNVLELFAGNGDLWKRVDKKITTFKIDADKRFKVDHVGDCYTWLKKNSVDNFGIIDVDCWGSPSKYLEHLFKIKYKGIVIATFCNPININPDKIFAIDYFGEDIYNSTKSKSILVKDANIFLTLYLQKRGVEKINGILSKKNNYIYFEML